jgi:glucose-6-phosphate 1-dehydrogenase
MVIFGASGDLTRRKLVPALYSLALDGLLPDRFAVVGYARRAKTNEEFREEMRAAVAEHARVRPLDEAAWARFAAGLYYCPGEFEDPQGYTALRALLEDITVDRGTEGCTLYYLATPPSAYETIVARLGAAGLVGDAEGRCWTRLIVEKPYGHDLASAQALNHSVHAVFDERQVYRIDHYLGKETTQNILAFRFGNSIFEPLWDRRYVDHVQITVAESLGVEGRGGYYETAGALRDIVQNHMMQLLALVAMEPPARFGADAVRDEKVKVLQAIRPLSLDDVARQSVRGQYGAGQVDGRALPDYRAEPDVAPDSRTETYVALRLDIDNWRWAGVPFFLRTGKALPKRVTEVVIQFRQPPLLLFEDIHQRQGDGDHLPEPNQLRLRIQPDEGISLCFGLKQPGPQIVLLPVTMAFSYRTTFGAEPREAYERLLHDAMLGDRTLFIRRDEVEVSWALADALQAGWNRQPDGPERYPAGSWGPAAADALIGAGGREWTPL